MPGQSMNLGFAECGRNLAAAVSALSTIDQFPNLFRYLEGHPIHLFGGEMSVLFEKLPEFLIFMPPGPRELLQLDWICRHPELVAL